MDYDYPPVEIPHYRYLDLSTVHESVVKLSFLVEGKPFTGTGFFFKIPDSPYEVILTAGHNLYTAAKTYTTQVQILFPNPSSPEPHAVPVLAEHIKVSAEYLNDPSNTEADYGAILIPYTGKRRGFGYKMMHAFAELRGKISVSAHGDETQPGRPLMSDGPVVINECTKDQLSYEVTAEPGNSGSPVWLLYNEKVVAVVGIHNHGPAPGGKGHRGTRITPKVLREVFAWAALDTKKQIKAQNLSKKDRTPTPPSGLFMIFAERPFARIRRGTGTEFEVFPAEVTKNSVRYVLALGEKWVMFDTENQQAVLVDKPQEQSLFAMDPMKVVTDQNRHIVYISIENKYKLRLDGAKFKAHDLPDAQAAGVEMVTTQTSFLHFTFHPYKPFTLLPTAAKGPDNKSEADPDPNKSGKCSLCGGVLKP